MKLISRKSLVAVACSAAMITGATVAPAMAADLPALGSSVGTTDKKDDAKKDDEKKEDGKKEEGKKEDGKGNNNAAAGSAATPKEMGEWAKAIAAIISTLTAIWTFVQKFLLKK